MQSFHRDGVDPRKLLDEVREQLEGLGIVGKDHSMVRGAYACHVTLNGLWWSPGASECSSQSSERAVDVKTIRVSDVQMHETKACHKFIEQRNSML